MNHAQSGLDEFEATERTRRGPTPLGQDSSESESESEACGAGWRWGRSFLFLVTSSKAPVTTSEAPVTNSFLLLLEEMVQASKAGRLCHHRFC